LTEALALKDFTSRNLHLVTAKNSYLGFASTFQPAKITCGHDVVESGVAAWLGGVLSNYKGLVWSTNWSLYIPECPSVMIGGHYSYYDSCLTHWIVV
jgi:hypothetical protein